MAAHWPDAVPLTVLMSPSSAGAGLLPVQESDPVTELADTTIPVVREEVLFST
jgi:hypothetical protein